MDDDDFAEAETWLREHGSTRLRKACDLGLLDQSTGIYQDERLRLERPQWMFQPALQGLGPHKIINPSEDALDGLIAALETVPDAGLRWTAGHPVLVAEWGRYRRAIWTPAIPPPWFGSLYSGLESLTVDYLDVYDKDQFEGGESRCLP